MIKAKREEFEEFLRANLPDEIYPRWEIRSLLEKARWFRGNYNWDESDLYRQMGEVLLQSKDEDFLKNCACALAIIKHQWFTLSCDEGSGYV